jgi:SAM-dependent methyltransferase
MKSLDLGCGSTPRNPFNAEDLYGIDIVDFSTKTFEVKTADLNIQPIPYPDNYFDYVTAYDFLEHVPRIIYLDGKLRNPFIELMNEIWRVLKPGGIFKAHTPHYPHPEVFQDPTHVNFITTSTIVYFTTQAHSLGRAYGFNGVFHILRHEPDIEHPFHLIWEMSVINKPV